MTRLVAEQFPGPVDGEQRAVPVHLAGDRNVREDLRQQLETIASEFLATQTGVTSAEEAARIGRDVIEEALGFGPVTSASSPSRQAWATSRTST